MQNIRNESAENTMLDLKSISYELRTPLNAILGFAQLLETDSAPLTLNQKAGIEQILQAGWDMLDCLNKIIDLTLRESAKNKTPALSLPSVLTMNVNDIFNAKILIVDDEEKNVVLLTTILLEAGYQSISSTTDSTQVHELHCEEHYDLILLDLQMPKMDGFHVMADLKKAAPEDYLPVIVISAHEESKVHALEAGAKDFISKPFDPAEVLMRIRSMLEVRLLHKESQNYSQTLEKIVTELRETEASLICAECILAKEKAALSENILELREANATLVSDNIEAQTLTKKTEKAKIKMTHLAQHDTLTGLPNRLLLHDRLNQMITMADRQNKLFAVMFLDLDGFKQINDLHGHLAGDQVLQIVAKRLLDSVRNSDTVCRQGGDEFVILITEIEHPEYAMRDMKKTAKKILLAFTKPYFINESEIQSSVSIGISFYPSNGLDAQTLIQNADIAMYRAKESGRNNYQFFE
jgi:diguanylate cyclase (GGDEF)-like protein